MRVVSVAIAMRGQIVASPPVAAPARSNLRPVANPSNNAARRRVGVIFGGRSVEHDVSIITAQQVMAVLAQRHEVVPIYLAADGRFWTGESLLSVDAFATQPPADARPLQLRLGVTPAFVEPSTSRLRGDRDVLVDVVVNAIHGTSGEDGSLLGALELAGIPYVGRGVAAAAVSMDKHLAKVVLKDAGIEVLPHRRIERSEWESDQDGLIAELVQRFPGDVVVKPCTLGSSVGVARANGADELIEALELAFELDRQAIVEPFATGAIELNAAVVGRPGGELIVSEVERPIGGEDGLSFEDKYLRAGGGKGGSKDGSSKGAASAKSAGAAAGGAGSKGGGAGMATQDRIIPADVSPQLRAAVQEQAKIAHAALRLAGVVRYDFFVLPGDRIVINEPNTVPGSFAFYLFEAAGVTFDALMERLLAIAFEEAREERSTTRAFESALLGLHIGAS
jgi:D-alanine-D-alanine ligase